MQKNGIEVVLVGKLMNCHDYSTEVKTLFLEKLASTLPGSLNGIQMYCAGTEAVEAAMRAARAATKKQLENVSSAHYGRRPGCKGIVNY